MISTSRLRGTEYLPKNTYSNAGIAAKMPADIVRMGSTKKAEGLKISRKIKPSTLPFYLKSKSNLVYLKQKKYLKTIKIKN